MAYRERLTVPALWWGLAVLLAGSMGVAVGAYVGFWWGMGVGVIALAVATAVLLSAAVVITVDGARLCVGRAMIEISYLGGCRALDQAATGDRSGPNADARAYLVLRPYIRTSVEVTVSDPADPVPYWLISTRRPAALAAAVEDARAARLRR